MGIYQNFNERAKRMSIVDIKLGVFGGMFFALVIAKLVPQIMEINIWWFVALGILFILRPLYVFYFNK